MLTRSKFIIKNIFYVLIITLLISEIVLRNSINWIPEDLIEYLSSSAISKVTKERGQIQEDGTPIYHYKPFQKINWYPYIKIDESGYRNSIYKQNKVETVLLGDSIIFAKASENDLGDLFRKEGKSALNLGMGGYSPQHYRDVYKKYVIEKNVQHKNVIVSIFVGNDFDESVKYPWILSPPTAKGNQYFPWIINLMFGAVDLYRQGRYYKEEIKYKISLPYGEIGINYLWWPPVPSDERWSKVDSALNDIVKMASKANAKVSFVIIPSPASVYGVQVYPEFSLHLDRHNKIVDEFRKRFKNINIIDPNNKLAKKIEKKFLYTSESDAHFNTYGIEVFFDIINSELELASIDSF